MLTSQVQALLRDRADPNGSSRAEVPLLLEASSARSLNLKLLARCWSKAAGSKIHCKSSRREKRRHVGSDIVLLFWYDLSMIWKMEGNQSIQLKQHKPWLDCATAGSSKRVFVSVLYFFNECIAIIRQPLRLVASRKYLQATYSNSSMSNMLQEFSRHFWFH